MRLMPAYFKNLIAKIIKKEIYILYDIIWLKICSKLVLLSSLDFISSHQEADNYHAGERYECLAQGKQCHNLEF